MIKKTRTAVEAEAADAGVGAIAGDASSCVDRVAERLNADSTTLDDGRRQELNLKESSSRAAVTVRSLPRSRCAELRGHRREVQVENKDIE